MLAKLLSCAVFVGILFVGADADANSYRRNRSHQFGFYNAYSFRSYNFRACYAPSVVVIPAPPLAVATVVPSVPVVPGSIQQVPIQQAPVQTTPQAMPSQPPMAQPQLNQPMTSAELQEAINLLRELLRAAKEPAPPGQPQQPTPQGIPEQHPIAPPSQAPPLPQAPHKTP